MNILAFPAFLKAKREAPTAIGISGVPQLS
jgi:hypothetical protein